ncbi:MAG: flagellar basal body rod modification protein [Mesorhizobium amorphae]|nr:MAG: flagellar basal body rod modification protein [Mesorhizobium amorphae]
MDVSALTTTIPAGANERSSASAKTTADYQSFLKLLVAQMKNQDPTKPMDPTQYVAQLASFSQVEQSVQTNKKLDQMLQASALSQADGLIGRTVSSSDGSVSGTVEALKLGTNGVTAILKGGAEIAVGPGLVISAGAQS